MIIKNPIKKNLNFTTNFHIFPESRKSEPYSLEILRTGSQENCETPHPCFLVVVMRSIAVTRNNVMARVCSALECQNNVASLA